MNFLYPCACAFLFLPLPFSCFLLESVFRLRSWRKAVNRAGHSPRDVREIAPSHAAVEERAMGEALSVGSRFDTASKQAVTIAPVGQAITGTGMARARPDTLN